MQRWQGLDDVPDGWGRSVVTIGVFDGVHPAISASSRRAAEAGRRSSRCRWSWSPSTRTRTRWCGPAPIRRSCRTARRRAELLAGPGRRRGLLLPFTLEFSRLGPDEFVQAVLVDRLHAARVVVGENFRFGHRAAGNVALLGELGEKYDFAAEGVPLLAEAGETISSTGIRARLAAGDVAGAARDLGRPHRVEGIVARGHRRGRSLGFPTANLETLPHTAIPADGVYAGWLASLDPAGIEEERWPAAISIGTNPTFDGRERTVEAYALDRDDLDLYGAHVAIDFAARLRGTVRFDSVGELVTQMRRDVDAAREITGRGRGTVIAGRKVTGHVSAVPSCG